MRHVLDLAGESFPMRFTYMDGFDASYGVAMNIAFWLIVENLYLITFQSRQKDLVFLNRFFCTFVAFKALVDLSEFRLSLKKG